jgi:hypothetical protein
MSGGSGSEDEHDGTFWADLQSVGQQQPRSSSAQPRRSSAEPAVKASVQEARPEAVVVHLDIDCFFAQVEERADPSLKGRPVGVQQNMEVAAVNYEARAFGLFNRISVQEALRLCPQLTLVRGDNFVNGASVDHHLYVDSPAVLTRGPSALQVCSATARQATACSAS